MMSLLQTPTFLSFLTVILHMEWLVKCFFATSNPASDTILLVKLLIVLTPTG